MKVTKENINQLIEETECKLHKLKEFRGDFTNKCDILTNNGKKFKSIQFDIRSIFYKVNNNPKKTILYSEKGIELALENINYIPILTYDSESNSSVIGIVVNKDEIYLYNDINIGIIDAQLNMIEWETDDIAITKELRVINNFTITALVTNVK